MLEFEYFDGYDTATLNIIDNRFDNNGSTTKSAAITETVSRKILTIAITYLGKISVCEYEIFEDRYGEYIEFGPLNDQIYLEEFEFID